MKTSKQIWARSSKSSSGFSLIECIVYVGVLVVVLTVAFMTYYKAELNNRNLRRSADDILRAMNVGEQWREDVRKATRPIRANDRTAEQEVIIPQGAAEVRYAFRNGEVWRQSGARPVMVLTGVVDSRMQKDQRQHVTAWRWEVELARRQKGARLRPLFTFESVQKEQKP